MRAALFGMRLAMRILIFYEQQDGHHGETNSEFE